jgi:hypothetical protein
MAMDSSALPSLPSGTQFPALGGVSRRKLVSAQVIARLADGTPAITINRYGKGSVLFFGTNAGEAYNYGNLLSMGRYRLPRGQKLDVHQYGELVKRYEGWQNYAVLLKNVLGNAGVDAPVSITSPDHAEIRNIARASLQEHREPASGASNHLLVVTLEPIYDPVAEIEATPEHPAKAQSRVLANVTLDADVPDAKKVRAVYRIPVMGYGMEKIDAVPGQIRFEIVSGRLRIHVPEISEAACFLIARDARPLVGVRSEKISAVESAPTRVTVTVDNAAPTDLSGEIALPNGFRAVPVNGNKLRFVNLHPRQRFSGTFDVYAPFPIDLNRTFHATVRYTGGDGRIGTSDSYPVTSRTGERIAHGWLKRVEAAMTEAATTAGTPHGDLYEEALQKREFVYAAYNKGEWAETVRLAKEHLRICDGLKKARLRGDRVPEPE